MKKLALIPLFIAIVAVVSVGWFFINVQPVGGQNSPVSFSVSKGSSAAKVGADLYNNGLIRSPIAFKIYIQFTGTSNNIKAGEYKLYTGDNLFQTVDRLNSSPLAIKVTIPEGYTNKEIADKFSKALNKGTDFTQKFMSLSAGDQGYLFPDTYLVAENASPETIIALMKKNFANRTLGMDISKDELVLASIIESETKGDDERPIVAGILMNRLNIGMALQVDVAPETYKSPGLPLLPISNPGLVSLKAATSPTKTKYLYYLHDSGGQIHYAETLEGHNANIRKYLK